MRLSLDHKKTSVNLTREVIISRYSDYDLEDLIPMNYYPRLDSHEGREFILTYLQYADDMSIIKKFIQRGMDINAAVDSNGNRLLHHMMDYVYRYTPIFARLYKEIEGIDLNVKNNAGQKPLDLLINRKHHASTAVVMLFLKAEEKALEGESFSTRKWYMQHRLHHLAKFIPAENILALVPTQIDFNDALEDRSVMMTLAQNGHIGVLEKLAGRPDFKPKNLQEQIILAVVNNGNDTSIVLPLMQKLLAKGYRLDADVVNAALEKGQLDVVDYILSTPEKEGGLKYDAAQRRQLFEWIIKNKTIAVIEAAAKLKTFARVADIDARVFEGGTTRLMQAVTANSREDVQKLLAMGASLEIKNDAGLTARDIAQTVRNSDTVRKILEERWLEMNRCGDYERVDPQQIAWKRGVLTYIFDFSAGQVIVRDDVTKGIAMQSMADFSKSGEDAVSDAAKVLEDLGGTAKGYAQRSQPARAGATIKKTIPV